MHGQILQITLWKYKSLLTIFSICDMVSWYIIKVMIVRNQDEKDFGVKVRPGWNKAIFKGKIKIIKTPKMQTAGKKTEVPQHL